MPTDELSKKIFETLKKEFQEKYDSDTLIQELKKQIKKGNGDYELAHAYSKKIGEILSEVFSTKINDDVLPNGKMYFQMANDTIKPMLEQNHNIVNGICKDIQTNLNSEAGIKIKPAIVPIDENRINGIMTMIWQSEKFNDIKPQLSSATTNYTQSVVDKNIKANADLHYKSGLTPKIERISKGKCCKWCENLSGVYNYEDVKDKGNNVFRRHENCNCLVIYKPVSGKKQNVHTKQFIRNENAVEKRKNYNIDIPHRNSIIKEKVKSEWDNDLAPRGQIEKYIAINDRPSFVANELNIPKEQAENYVDAVNAFSDDYYSSIRAFQRGETVENIERIQSMSDNIEEYIKKAPRWNGGETFRGISCSDEEIANSYIGKIDGMGGVSSWSNEISIAEDFAEENISQERPNQVIYHCKTQSKGTGIKHLSQYRGESEVLCSKESRYKIVNINKKDGIFHVYLEEV